MVNQIGASGVQCFYYLVTFRKVFDSLPEVECRHINKLIAI